MYIFTLFFFSYMIVSFLIWIYYWLLSPTKNKHVVKFRRRFKVTNPIHWGEFIFVTLLVYPFFTPFIFVADERE